MAVKKSIPKVAIITRTKDRPLLLKRALKSIADQTFSDYLLVIVNDGGDKEVLESVVKECGGFKGDYRVIHNDVSIGMQPAANKAIKSCKSKYVIVHDDDDSWDALFLEKTVEHLAKSNAKGVIAKTEVVYEKIENDEIVTLRSEPYYPDLERISLFKLCFENYATPICFLYERSVLEEVGYYDEDLGGVADWDFGIRFMCKYDIDFLNTKLPLAYYHHRPDASGIDANSISTAKHQELINKMLNKYLREDLKNNRLGIGYLINALKWDELIERKLQYTLGEHDGSVKKEINQLADKIESRFDEQKQLTFDSPRRSFEYFVHLPVRLVKKIAKAVK